MRADISSLEATLRAMVRDLDDEAPTTIEVSYPDVCVNNSFTMYDLQDAIAGRRDKIAALYDCVSQMLAWYAESVTKPPHS